MKAAIFQQTGLPADVLEATERPIPEPGPGEILIRVIASPINPSDLSFIQNRYGIRPKLPDSGAGFEGVGVIEKPGEGVDLRIGMRVSFTSVGTWAEYAIANAQAIIPIPDMMTDDVAAQLFVNPFTAYAMVQDSGVKAGPDQWLMLTAAGSAFGKMVIQLCHLKGINVIGTVRRDDLNDELKALGLTAVINTETEDMAHRVKQITGGKGVQCVLDAVGGHTATEALKCLAKNGTMLVYGLMSSEDPIVNVGLMIFKGLTVKGFWLSDWMKHADSQIRKEVAQQVISLLASGTIKLPVEASYGLDQIKEAVQHADRPGRHGKILVRP
ncbi:zinc-dependent alcohol dehydrogenase family protein [Arsenicibacter rosenii]|uniref:Alcohol dehydrogenase n=1 Tax=Arsenicibacter rosenii TaxID=1750698 RepID=A0A1S2VP11_9BACT|nr:zinc-dependent alcohol dehydrogenase family protein [Arsenicibacter rosenii]OIN60140.1 alcohol dehydrogenase [Arsenicibacter rosenii]